MDAKAQTILILQSICCQLRKRGLDCSVVDPWIEKRNCYISIHLDTENLIFLDQGKPDHLIMTHTASYDTDLPPIELELSDPTIFDQITKYARTMDEWANARRD